MDQPIACTLHPEQYERRTRDLSGLAARRLRSREPTSGGGERLVFAGDADTERDLRAAVAAEAGCCAFLRMELRRAGDSLVLDVSGPDEARPLIAELFAA
jgi:hypothetical protein